VVADSHSFDEEQDPKPDCIEVKNWIRFRIKVMRIRNPAKKDYQTKVSASRFHPNRPCPSSMGAFLGTAIPCVVATAQHRST
jgi:hypothetical protein